MIDKCELCELNEVCSLINEPKMPLYINCEAFKDVVRKYGGKNKLLDDIFEMFKKETPKLEQSNCSYIFEIKKKGINNYDDESVAFNRFLQSDPLGTVSAWSDQNGFILHTPNVSLERHEQGYDVRITSVH